MNQIEDVFTFNRVAGNRYVRGEVDWPQLRQALNHCQEELTEMNAGAAILHDQDEPFHSGELSIGTWCETVAEVADGAVDLIYVAINVLYALGVDAERLWAEVHRANMAKVGPDGKVTRNAEGKVMKPAGWSPPDLARIIMRDFGGL